ncbi:MAG TPA: SDR family NAD(P)-dependent oxidoreductase [Symbiobacteriaceae bacterium]|jgi:acyl transferase domain-containing protein
MNKAFDSRGGRAKRHEKDIAIVGVSCRLPGARNYEEFWQNLVRGVVSVQEVHADRWSNEEYYSPDISAPNKSVSKWCAAVDQVDQFDPGFFQISPREANSMDPQQRLLLEETWHCIEDSGIPLWSLQQKTTGVYMGVLTVDYRQDALSSSIQTDNYACLGTFESIIANRVSHLMDLKGPSIAVNAACASSAVAIHMAKQALLLGECDYALVGGVNLNLHPWKYIGLSKSRMLSSDGQCKPFDINANGYVPGDGVGVLLLQRATDAMLTNNHIYGLIKGSSVSHSGKTLSISAPRGAAWKAVFLAAYEDAEVSPATVSYVEAGGSGTALGDPVEIESLARAFQPFTREPHALHVGSLKPNIGHLEAASGVTAVIKVLMMMRNRQIAPTLLNERSVNPMIDFAKTPVSVATRLTEWTNGGTGPLRAGVNSFGFGGVNCHLVLEEYVPSAKIAPTGLDHVFTLSAKTQEALNRIIADWVAFSTSESFLHTDVSDLCKTLAVGREAFPFRCGTVVRNHQDIIPFLKEAAGRREIPAGSVSFALKIGDLVWRDASQFDNLAELYPIIDHKWKLVVELAAEAVGSEALTGIGEMAWREADRPLYSFLLTYVYISALMDLGLSPRQVAGEKAGLWVSLAVSQMVQFEDAVAVLAGKKTLSQVTFRRPALPYVDCTSGITVLPCRFHEDYLPLLMKEFDTDTLRQQYLEKVRILREKQPTFSKFMNEWQLAAGKASSVAGALDDHEVLFWIAALDSLRRLHKKWDLGDIACSEGVRELLDLLEDNVVSRQDVASLLLDGSADKAAVAAMLNERWQQVDLTKPYTLLRSLGESITEVEDLPRWVRMLLEVGGNNIGTGNEVWFEFQAVSPNPETDFRQTVLQLWLHGASVDWARLYPETTFSKVSLPGYSFERKSFWLPINRGQVTPVAMNPLRKAPRRTEQATAQQPHQVAAIREKLRRILAGLTALNAADIDADTSLREFNLDSVLLMEFSDQINRVFRTDISPPILFEQPTLSRLAEYVASCPTAEGMPEVTAEVTPGVGAPESSEEVALLEDQLLELLAGVLSVDRQDLDGATDFPEFGLKPASLAEFTNRICHRLGVEIDSAQLLQCGSLRSVARYLHAHRPARTEGLSRAPGATVRATVVPPGVPERVQGPRSVAIIGMSGRYPGCRHVRELWKNLLANKDLITEIPSDRWDWRQHDGDPLGDEEKTNIRWGGFMDDIRRFDAEFFRISRREAELMDPQQRLTIEEAWRAIEDAGYKPSSLSGSKTGVFVGAFNDDYNTLLIENHARAELYTSTGTSFSIIPNRISYLLNLHGLSMAIDTACSGALMAVHQAVRAIQNGDCTTALAGGVSLIASPRKYFAYSNAGMLGEDGRCKTFDAGANGYVRAEGVGMVFLKPLEQAIADGDHIYAVIRGSAVNHGGFANTLTAPNPDAQAELVVSAYSEADIDPETVGFIETHGTGTKLGDPIEINGLKKAFAELYTRRGKQQTKSGYCGLGAIKTNMGHLEPAAGIAGLTKLLLCLKHRQLPGNVHTKAINPYIQLQGSPFYLVSANTEWVAPRDESGRPLPRRGSVSAFGYGGANAHVVLEEYSQSRSSVTDREGRPHVFVLSARNRERLLVYAAELQQFLTEEAGALPFGAVAYTLQTGREEMEERLAIVAESYAELVDALSRFCSGKGSRHTYVGRVQSAGVGGNAPDAGDLQRLARQWVEGAAVDWRSLHSPAPERVSLPTYPFGGEQYWLAEVPAAAAPQGGSGAVSFFTPHWTRASLPAARDSGLQASCILLLDLGRGDSSALSERLAALAGSRVVSVGPGAQFARVARQIYEVVPDNPDDFVRLLGELEREELAPQSVVVRWQPTDGEKSAVNRDAGVALSAVLALAMAVQSTLRSGSVKEFLVLAETAGPDAEPLFESVAGFFRSMGNSMFDTRFSLVQVPRNSPADLAQRIADEVSAGIPGQAMEVWYGGSARSIRRVRPAVMHADATGRLLRSRGVYLITGGAGELGFAFARYLASTYQARLILLGRSPLDGKRQERVQALTRLGAEVLYIQADVSDRKAMRDVMAQVKQRFGALNGVIHAAGTFGDAQGAMPDLPSFVEHLRPKVHGTGVLDEVTRDEALDFFAAFSSISSLLGDFGQGCYATGNRFLDSFVHWRESLRQKGRRHGRTFAINWPLWREGGMHLAGDAESLYLQSSGQVYLETADGLSAFETILQSEHTQVIVMAGDPLRIGRLFEMDSSEVGSVVSERPHQKEPAGSSSRALGQSIESDVRRIAAELVKTAPEQISETSVLGNYGFDSILLKRFARKLSELYQIQVSPNVFFAASTIRQLASYLQESFPQVIKSYYSADDRSSLHPGEALPTPSAEAPKQAVGPVTTGREPVAIVGAFGLFPGSKDLEEFWENISTNKDLITEVPPERWDWRRFYGNPAEDKTRIRSKWGGFIEDVDKFDAPFFAISPREAELMDPQQRKFLEVVWKTLEDAGYKPSQLSGRTLGVFAGVQFHDYQDLMASMEVFPAQMLTGTAHAMLSNRVSFLLNARGPSEVVDTACSGSLLAVHRAVKAIQGGECELAIAGGVSLALAPFSMVSAGQMGILSPDGKCKTFDQSANGYVKGEGAGAILLKPLSQALADHDHIYGVIRGSAVNHGGRANSLTAPNFEAQAELLLKAWEDAQIDPGTLTYIEAHGTGTELGDPVEVEGIKRAFARWSEKHDRPVADTAHCGLGTVKTNIGHLEPAAGIAGLIKVLVAMRHGELPGLSHFTKLNPYIEFGTTPLYVVDRKRPWERLKDGQGQVIPRRAGVSSFGFGGANAHVVVEEHIAAQVSLQRGDTCVAVLSAHTEERLKVYAQDLADFLARSEAADRPLCLEDVAYTLQVGRVAFDERLAIVAGTVTELRESLLSFCSGQTGRDHRIMRGNARAGRANIALLADDPQFLQSLAAQRKLDKLAQVWVSGLDVDWSLMYGRELPHRISVPTYPFEKTRFWFDGYMQKSRATGKAGPAVEQTQPMATVAAASNAGQLEEYTGNEVVLQLIDDQIALITMQDREHRNMHTDEILRGLAAKFAQVNRNDKLKAVILTGYDNVFSMGGTDSILQKISCNQEKCSDFRFVYSGLAECNVPVIAAIQGHAMGGGLVLGLFADIVVMALEGVYSANFTQYGFTPGVGSTFILKEKLGSNLANEMMFTAKSFEGADLRDRGASMLFRPQAEVMGEAVAIARMLAKKPRPTLQVLKQELAGRMLQQLPKIIESEVGMHERTFAQVNVDPLIRHYIRTSIAEREATEKGKLALKPADAGQPSAAAPSTVEPRRLVLKTTSAPASALREPASTPVESKPARGTPTQSFHDSRIDMKREVAAAGVARSFSTQDEERVRGQIIASLSDVLHTDGLRIDPNAAFRELGLDSINGVELVRDLNRVFKVNLEAVALYDYSTVTSLARFILSQLPQNMPAEASGAPDTTQEDRVVALLQRLQNNELNIDEVEQMLGETV